MKRTALFGLLGAAAASLLILVRCGGSTASDNGDNGDAGAPDSGSGDEVAVGPGPDASAAAEKIKHVIVIMQENRSFDHYFGTYPGAEGLPREVDGGFAPCLPDPNSDAGCVRPFHLTTDKNYGGPHGAKSATGCIDNGKMGERRQLSTHPQIDKARRPGKAQQQDESGSQNVRGAA